MGKPVKKKTFVLSAEPVFGIVLTEPFTYEDKSPGVWHQFAQGSIVELTWLNETHSEYADYVDFRDKSGLVQMLHKTDFLILK